jgi:hypothetical protein
VNRPQPPAAGAVQGAKGQVHQYDEEHQAKSPLQPITFRMKRTHRRLADVPDRWQTPTMEERPSCKTEYGKQDDRPHRTRDMRDVAWIGPFVAETVENDSQRLLETEPRIDPARIPPESQHNVDGQHDGHDAAE